MRTHCRYGELKMELTGIELKLVNSAHQARKSRDPSRRRSDLVKFVQEACRSNENCLSLVEKEWLTLEAFGEVDSINLKGSNAEAQLPKRDVVPPGKTFDLDFLQTEHTEQTNPNLKSIPTTIPEAFGTLNSDQYCDMRKQREGVDSQLANSNSQHDEGTLKSEQALRGADTQGPKMNHTAAAILHGRRVKAETKDANNLAGLVIQEDLDMLYNSPDANVSTTGSGDAFNPIIIDDNAVCNLKECQTWMLIL